MYVIPKSITFSGNLKEGFIVKDSMIVIKLPSPVKEMAKRRAKRDGITMSELVRRAIENYSGERVKLVPTSSGIKIVIPSKFGQFKFLMPSAGKRVKILKRGERIES